MWSKFKIKDNSNLSVIEPFFSKFFGVRVLSSYVIFYVVFLSLSYSTKEKGSSKDNLKGGWQNP